MEKKLLTSLIGKAGMGLAMFHLARLGHDFVATTGDSADGDLWVRIGPLPEVVEVKASTGPSWNVRREQAQRVSRFIFASIASGECWLAHGPAVLGLIGERTSCSVTAYALGKIGATPMHRGISVILGTPKTNTDEVATWKVVRAKLADGSTREYRYPRRLRSGARIRV